MRPSAGRGLLRFSFPVSRPHPEGAPHDGAHALVEREGEELPLVVPADERIVGLVSDVPRQAVAFGNRERLHQVPAREVGAADVADLPRAHHVAECAEGLLDGRACIETVELEQIDVLGAQPPQARLDRRDQVVARRADVVRSPCRVRNVAFVEIRSRLRLPAMAFPRISSARPSE